MTLKNVFIGLSMVFLCACSTTSQISREQATQMAAITDDHTVIEAGDNSTARKIVAFPLKAVGLAAAGVGLLMVELASGDHSTDEDRKDRDAGLTLSGIGLALGGALMYELGESLSD